MHCLVLFLSIIFSFSSSLNILVHSPAYAASHTNFLARIADSLTEAGHNVTFFMPIVDESRRNHMGVRVTKDIIVVEQDDELKSQLVPLDDIMGLFWTLEVTSSTAPRTVEVFHKISVPSCGNMFRNKAIIEQLRKRHYDVAITEPLQMCGLALFRHLGIEKVVMANSCVNYDVLIPATGEPEETSYLPSMSTPFTDQMNFWERLENFKQFNSLSAAFAQMFDDETSVYRKYLGPNFPDWRELVRDASIHLVNAISFLDFPRPSMPKTIPIGGISVDFEKIRSEKLSPELNEILDKRPRNMLLSFGSIAKSSDMPDDFKRNLLTVFRSEPNVTFIWKYETNDVRFAGGVDNVVFLKWTPQAALMNDKRLTAFLGHGGLGGTNEAAHLGIPAIMVPINADQSRNSNMLARHGGAIVLHKRYLGDVEAVKSSFRSILYDETYRISAQKVSEMLQNQPLKAKETAVKYIEFVGKYGPFHQMTPHSLKMPAYQRYNYDIYAYFLLPYLLVPVVAYVLKVAISRAKTTKTD